MLRGRFVFYILALRIFKANSDLYKLIQVIHKKCSNKKAPSTLFNTIPL